MTPEPVVYIDGPDSVQPNTDLSDAMLLLYDDDDDEFLASARSPRPSPSSQRCAAWTTPSPCLPTSPTWTLVHVACILTELVDDVMDPFRDVLAAAVRAEGLIQQVHQFSESAATDSEFDCDASLCNVAHLHDIATAAGTGLCQAVQGADHG